MSRGKLRVAVVGLRFGGCFPDIYKDHPDVEYVGICDSDTSVAEEVRRRAWYIAATFRLSGNPGFRSV